MNITTIFLALLALALGTVQALKQSKQELYEQLVYPWPTRADWPSLKMSYNYVLAGDIKGSEIVKDGTYSYSKEKGYVEPKVERDFSYHTRIKVDSKNERAVQKLWKDAEKTELLAVNAIDFKNARFMKVEYEGNPGYRIGKCKIYQFIS